VTARPRHRLHPVEIISMAFRTARAEPARVVLPALLIFGVVAFQGTLFTEISVDHLGLESVIGVLFSGVSTLGITFYSGMLERLVGSVERNEPAQPVLDVMRTLPWLRLLVADTVLVLFELAAALLAVVPGLVVDTLFALVGPLINLLDSSVPDAFRRSVRLVLPHFLLVFFMITLPLALEHEIVVLLADVVPHEKVALVFLTSWELDFVFGVALGLVEVTLAERLVRGAHGPGEALRSEDIELIDLGDSAELA
jgi:hypothetical protein